MKKHLIYIAVLLGSGLFGLLINNYVPDALSFLKNGPLNFALYGAAGFGICALVYKEYLKLLWVPVIAVVGVLGTLVYLFQGG